MEVCSCRGVSNGKFSGNCGEIPLVGVFGADSGAGGGSSDGIPEGKFFGKLEGSALGESLSSLRYGVRCYWSAEEDIWLVVWSSV